MPFEGHSLRISPSRSTFDASDHSSLSRALKETRREVGLSPLPPVLIPLMTDHQPHPTEPRTPPTLGVLQDPPFLNRRVDLHSEVHAQLALSCAREEYISGTRHSPLQVRHLCLPSSCPLISCSLHCLHSPLHPSQTLCNIMSLENHVQRRILQQILARRRSRMLSLRKFN